MAKRNFIGIRELKDDTSEIINQVLETGSSVTITKHSKPVARIVPISDDPMERLVRMGIISTPASRARGPFKLNKIKGNAQRAVQSILEDRDDR